MHNGWTHIVCLYTREYILLLIAYSTTTTIFYWKNNESSVAKKIGNKGFCDKDACRLGYCIYKLLLTERFGHWFTGMVVREFDSN